MPHSAASDLGLHCLPMAHKKDARLIWVEVKQAKGVVLMETHTFGINDRVSIPINNPLSNKDTPSIFMRKRCLLFTRVLQKVDSHLPG